MNQDYIDLLRAFVAADVRFLIVGAYALAVHGRPPPGRIDILTDLTGVAFSEAWPDRLSRRVGEVNVNFIGRVAFIRNKRATGRTRDLADIEGLD